MKAQYKSNVIISIFTVTLLISACNRNQAREANQLIEEANARIVQANELFKETEKKNRELFAPHIQTNEELKIYKVKMKTTAESIIKDFAKSSKLATQASASFEKASRLSLPEKYKEYLEIKSQELSKRAEAVEMRKGNAQAFLDYDDSTMVKKFEENNEKSERLMKEAREFSEKAEKIQQENKIVFYAEAKIN